MVMKRTIMGGLAAALLGVWTLPAPADQNFADQLRAPIDQSIDTRVRGQAELDQWQRERARLMERHEALTREAAALTEQLDGLQTAIAGQEAENLSLETRLAEAEAMAAAMAPFLESVYPRLEQLVETGLPFLPVERRERLNHLKETLDDPAVSLSEKFRKTMEILFIEAAYGNTAEVYQEQLQVEDHQRLFSVLRVGRLALFCLSPDLALAGYFNVAESKWRLLPGHWRRELQASVEMVEKRRPPDLVRLPLGRLGE